MSPLTYLKSILCAELAWRPQKRLFLSAETEPPIPQDRQASLKCHLFTFQNLLKMFTSGYSKVTLNLLSPVATSPGGVAHGRVVDPPDWVIDYWHPSRESSLPRVLQAPRTTQEGVHRSVGETTRSCRQGGEALTCYCIVV